MLRIALPNLWVDIHETQLSSISSALALRCCEAHGKINRKMENSSHGKL